MSRAPITTPEGDVLSPKLTYRVALVDELGRERTVPVVAKVPSRRHAEDEIDRLCAMKLFTRDQLKALPNMGAISIEVIND